jgi:hypothetical protein
MICGLAFCPQKRKNPPSGWTTSAKLVLFCPEGKIQADLQKLAKYLPNWAGSEG